jgi:hypothetical protein
MSSNHSRPSFHQFTRWVAVKSVAGGATIEVPEAIREAARATRNDAITVARTAIVDLSLASSTESSVEVIRLLAAASADDNSRPPELMTARGFRVTLAYDEGTSGNGSSICVLVRAPNELIDEIQGQTAFLWNGAERFELGQFDSDGKAIGTLPAGIEISLSDFVTGRVKLEGPIPSAKD